MTDTKTPHLLPCPFCGGDARHDAHADDCYLILHRKMKGSGADMSPAFEVLEAWNRRAPQAVASGEPVEHKQGCPALGGYGNGAEPCCCGAAPPPQALRETTPIRRAALELYTPPFRHEHGYIRDANHQMVADDASSEATGLIAARIRGWGRIQYMDKPEMRANALQDEVAEVVAEALNAYWSANGIIKGGQHGAE